MKDEKEKDIEKGVEPVGSSGSGLPWQMIAEAAATNVFGLISGQNADYKQGDLLRNAGTGYSSRMGVGYQTQNGVDSNSTMKEYDVNTAKQFLSGNVLGGLSRMIWGRGNQKKEINLANQYATRSNIIGGNIAASTAMRNNFALNYGDSEQQSMFAAAGKDSKTGTWAYVDPLEAGSDAEGNAHSFLNKGGIPGKDSIKMFIPADYTVHTRLNGHADVVNREAAVQEYLKSAVNNNKNNKDVVEKVIQKPLQESKQRVLQDQAMQKSERRVGVLPEEGTVMAKNGLDNLFAGLTGVGIGLGQYIDAYNQKIKSPYTFFKNPYQTSALSQLNGIRSNQYPIMQQIMDAEGRGRHQIASAGGLGAAQKYLGNVAMTLNTQNSIANALAQLQNQDNQYKTAAAQAALTAGAQEAQGRMQANQWDLDYYSKAHAARLGGMQTGLYNIQNSLQQYVANKNKLDMYNRMYDLYADYMNSKKPTTSNASPVIPNVNLSNLFQSQMSSYNKKIYNDTNTRLAALGNSLVDEMKKRNKLK